MIVSGPTRLGENLMATQLTAGMAARIKNILLQPSSEWERIDAEPMTERGIFTGWVMPLAAIGPVASFIGGQAFGYGAFGISYKPSLIGGLTTAIIGYVLALVGVWMLAKIVDALAPNFGGVKNPVAATKVVGYAWTASFVAGIFGILPSLWILGLLGLYSLYLLYLGLPKLMRSPPEKALGYTVVTCLCAIVIYIVVGAIAAAITSRIAAPMLSASAGTVSGNLAIPGVGTLDIAKIEAASKRMEGRANASAAGNVTPTAPDALAAMLPASTGGWTRTAVESSSGAAAGIGGSKAEGTYTLGTDTATLSVTDMAAMGAIAAMGSALNIQSSKTDAHGYEKTAPVDGRMTSESWNTTDRRGKYSTIVGERFVVEADGHAANIDALKALAASIDTATLERMAK
jgi:hypothetical protein